MREATVRTGWRSVVVGHQEADLTDLDEQQMRFSHLLLYEAGLEALKDGRVHCRTLRSARTQLIYITDHIYL